MANLPPFEELMASLGLDKEINQPDDPKSTHSSRSSSPYLSVITDFPLPSLSNSSLRESTSRRVTRYSPYSATSSSARRGSLPISPVPSDFDVPSGSLRAYSASPGPTSPRPTSRSAPRLRRCGESKLAVNVYDSTSDLAANTPISTYVRRKTPSTSPTSLTFPRSDLLPLSPMPLSLPTLPPLSLSVNSYFFPSSSETPRSLSGQNSPIHISQPLTDFLDTSFPSNRRHMGVRISSPFHRVDIGEHHSCRNIAPIS